MGITLNEKYNEAVLYDEEGDPACEECGCDLTGKQVYELSCAWLCEKCRDECIAEYGPEADL